jgi:TonB family protein
VIRVKILSKAPVPAQRRLNRSALLASMLGVLAVSLSWVGISMLRKDRGSAPVATATVSGARSQLQIPASVPARSEPVQSEPVRSEPAKPLEPEQPEPSDAPPSPVAEVIPDVPRSALDTIHGTIRVSVRVIVDKDGAVLAATADDGGPSRYFERLAVEAAKKWTFTPAKSQEQRVMLVRFNFRRGGTTAGASALR